MLPGDAPPHGLHRRPGALVMEGWMGALTGSHGSNWPLISMHGHPHTSTVRDGERDGLLRGAAHLQPRGHLLPQGCGLFTHAFASCLCPSMLTDCLLDTHTHTSCSSFSIHGGVDGPASLLCSQYPYTIPTFIQTTGERMIPVENDCELMDRLYDFLAPTLEQEDLFLIRSPVCLTLDVRACASACLLGFLSYPEIVVCADTRCLIICPSCLHACVWCSVCSLSETVTQPRACPLSASSLPA